MNEASLNKNGGLYGEIAGPSIPLWQRGTKGDLSGAGKSSLPQKISPNPLLSKII
jgi:hypothetical protein